MPSDDGLASEVTHCPCCGQSEHGFDGMGHRVDQHVALRSGDGEHADAFKVKQYWYHFHCGDCGTEFQVLENELETAIDSGQEAADA